MSILDTAATIGSRFNQASAIFAGGGGGGPLTLGSFVFADMEIPESIAFGGSHKLNVHHFSGGQRVIDAMGRDDRKIAWGGIFIENGSARARQLDELRVAGKPINLVWNVWAYQVVIEDFNPDYKQFHIPYTISCVVVRDLTAGDLSSGPTLLQQVGNDINSAVGFDVAGTVSSALGSAQTAIGVVGALTGGSAALNRLQGLLNGANTGLATLQSVAGSSLLNTGLTAVSNPAQAVANLGAAVSNSALAANLSAAGGFVRRAMGNASPGSV